MNLTVRQIYSIDSSALIHGWHRAYRPRNFEIVWRNLDGLIAEGRLKASIEVLKEIGEKEDELLAWCKERREHLFVEIDDACQTAVSHIMGTYPRLVDTAKGRSACDPFVIGLAMSSRPFLTVVTEEKPGRQKIPDVCMAESVPWFGLADMIEQEDWRF